MMCAIIMVIAVAVIILIGKLADRADEKSEKWLWWAKRNYKDI